MLRVLQRTGGVGVVGHIHNVVDNGEGGHVHHLVAVFFEVADDVRLHFGGKRL